jgi:hypothetical protein
VFLHVFVLSVFAAGMISVLLLSQRGPQEPGQDMREDPGEPGEPGEQGLRAAA